MQSLLGWKISWHHSTGLEFVILIFNFQCSTTNNTGTVTNLEMPGAGSQYTIDGGKLPPKGVLGLGCMERSPGQNHREPHVSDRFDWVQTHLNTFGDPSTGANANLTPENATRTRPDVRFPSVMFTFKLKFSRFRTKPQEHQVEERGTWCHPECQGTFQE